jgi:cupin fold WbuC family metalloprotein
MKTAIFNDQPIFSMEAADIESLKQSAKLSPNRRFRQCLHYGPHDQTQEMLIVCCGDTIMPPHRHPVGRSESYHVVEGSMTVCFFDDEGRVVRKLQMGTLNSGKPFIYRVSEPIWHAPVPTSEWLVYHETFTGPFIKDKAVEFPAWLPEGTSERSIGEVLRKACSSA